MQLWLRVWNEKSARAPLATLALMLAVSLLWILSAVLGDDPVQPNKEKAGVDVVVKGRVDLSKAGPSDPREGGGPVRVHIQVPELAYQADIEPNPDGSFELPIKLQTEQSNLHYSVDLSQGKNRWTAVASQSLKTSTPGEVLELPPVSAEPPPDHQNPRAHLSDSGSGDRSTAESRQERRDKLKQARESRLQRRGRSKPR